MLKGLNLLSDRAIFGLFAEQLEIFQGRSWVDKLATFVESDSGSEKYAGLDRAPVLKEGQSGNNISRPTARKFEIANVDFDAGVGIPRKDLRRDKTGMLNTYIESLARRSITHWRRLMTDLIEDAHAITISRDGKFWFATDHFEGEYTGQANLVGANEINELAVVDSDAVTTKEMAEAVLAVITHMYGFKDAENEPFNEDAREFLVQLPVSLGRTIGAFTQAVITSANGQEDNPLIASGFKVEFEINPRLSWTKDFTIFRTDTSNKPLVAQSEPLDDGGGVTDEQNVELVVLGQDSDHFKLNNEMIVKINASRNAGLTHNWHAGVKATFSDDA